MATSHSHHYSISAWGKDSNGKLTSHRVTSEAMITEFARIGRAVPDYLAEILRDGIRYSFQDFDVLSAAMRELYKIDSDVWARIGTEEK